MKKLHLLPILLISFCLSAQDKGVRPLSAPARQVSAGGEASATAVTRAVVVGISNYLNIPDLQYANRDAEAFAGWLRSEAGGNVPEQQIELLLDSAATLGNVAMALTWLYEQSKEGDRAIIYFSGHGDVEKKMFGQPGYLLFHDAPKAVYMSGGTLSVSALQDVVATLTVERKAQVVMITDACRAGALAGSTIGGPQLTTAALQERFANAVRIMSCQPNEYSLESRQWGGGRGVFSYHLVEGLYGLADRDGDLLIKLKELGRYLEDRVPMETDPQVQNPVVLGDREMQLAVVSEPLLSARKVLREKEQPGFYSGDMRSMAGLLPAGADSSVQEVYHAFLAAVSAGWLMDSPAAERSATECYDILIRDTSIAALHGFIKRHFVAALVDESQVVTNKLLVTDPQIVSDVISRSSVFDHIHTYLARAIELLGERHFLYKHLRAKQLYFEAKTYRKENYPDWPADSLAGMYIRKLEEGLRFDSMAAYIYLELSICYSGFGDIKPEKALAYGKRALDLSPQSAVALFIVGNTYYINRMPVEAIPYFEQTLALDSTFFPTYIYLGQVYRQLGNNEKHKYLVEKYARSVEELIRLNPDAVPVLYYNQLGFSLILLGRIREAESVLLNAEKRSKGQAPNTYENLHSVYMIEGKWEEAIRAANRYLEFFPDDPRFTGSLGMAYQQLKQYSKTVEVLEKAFSSIENLNTLQNVPWLRTMLADGYKKLGRDEEAKIQFQKILELLPNPSTFLDSYMIGMAWLGLGDLVAFQKTIAECMDKFPGDPGMYYHVACLYSLAEQEQKALESLELAVKAGIDDFSFISSDTDFVFIRDKPGFKALMKKYFPEQVKD